MSGQHRFRCLAFLGNSLLVTNGDLEPGDNPHV